MSWDSSCDDGRGVVVCLVRRVQVGIQVEEEKEVYSLARGGGRLVPHERIQRTMTLWLWRYTGLNFLRVHQSVVKARTSPHVCIYLVIYICGSDDYVDRLKKGSVRSSLLSSHLFYFPRRVQNTFYFYFEVHRWESALGTSRNDSRARKKLQELKSTNDCSHCLLFSDLWPYKQWIHLKDSSDESRDFFSPNYKHF